MTQSSSRTALPSILWLEDNPSVVDLFKEEFELYFVVHQSNDFQEFKRISKDRLKGYDALLLDMEFPEGKIGLEAIQFCKSIGVNSPILILSNDESLSTRLEMLTNGAEDYLWKSMHPEEMLVRIRNAISRFHRNRKDREVSLAGISLFPHRLAVELSGLEIDFSKIEFHLLMKLIQNHPLPVSCEDLRVDVWKLPVLETGTINTFIWKINKKLSLWSYRIAKMGDGIFLQSKP